MRKLVWIINAVEVVKTIKAGKKLQCVIAWDEKLGMISKVLGVARITNAIDRDAKDAKETIVTNEIIDRV